MKAKNIKLHTANANRLNDPVYKRYIEDYKNDDISVYSLINYYLYKIGVDNEPRSYDIKDAKYYTYR